VCSMCDTESDILSIAFFRIWCVPNMDLLRSNTNGDVCVIIVQCLVIVQFLFVRCNCDSGGGLRLTCKTCWIAWYVTGRLHGAYNSNAARAHGHSADTDRGRGRPQPAEPGEWSLNKLNAVRIAVPQASRLYCCVLTSACD
jgi:hypothetical protein